MRGIYHSFCIGYKGGLRFNRKNHYSVFYVRLCSRVLTCGNKKSYNLLSNKKTVKILQPMQQQRG